MPKKNVHQKYNNAFKEILSQALKTSNIPLQESQLNLMQQHWDLIQAWNQRTNLTAIKDHLQAAHLLFADSLVCLPFLVPGSMLDIGSGAGFPGIPLAIACPNRSVTLMEVRQKKVSFLQNAAARLGLKNLEVLCQDALITNEEQPLQTFANVVTRATFSNPKDLQACQKWVAAEGRMIVFSTPQNQHPDHDRAVQYSILDKHRVLLVWDAPPLT